MPAASKTFLPSSCPTFPMKHMTTGFEVPRVASTMATATEWASIMIGETKMTSRASMFGSEAAIVTAER